MLEFAKLSAVGERILDRAPETADADPVARLRRRGFVAAHLTVGVAPFAALPALIAFGPTLSGLSLAALAWATAPLLIALHLSQNGDLVRAGRLSMIAFTGLAFIAAAATGGVASFAAPWLLLPLIEAALSGSRRRLSESAVLATCALAGLTGVTIAEVSPAAPLGALGPIAAVVVGLYTASLGLRAAALIAESGRAGERAQAAHALMQASVSDLVTRHGGDGGVLFASPAARDLLSCAPRDLIEDGLLARVNIADRPAYLQTIANACDGAEPRAVELRLKTGEGGAPRFVWVEMRARKLGAAEAGEGACVVATFRDVADRKAHEEALVAAREEADRANLAKTRFLANMSHELRTPLNAIIGFSEILSDETLCQLTPEKRADYAALIHKSGAHLLEVVNSILDMAKIESGAFSIVAEPCDIEPVVAHCVSLMALKAEAAGVRLNARIESDAPMINADRRALTQILLNLVSNAIKFTPPEGAVDVEVESRPGALALMVRDTGVGIAADDIARLGEAFFQVDPSYGRQHDGAGLGLSVVRGLVALHHGEMTVESVVGRGTRVVILLPAEQGAARRTPPSLPSLAERVRLRA